MAVILSRLRKVYMYSYFWYLATAGPSYFDSVRSMSQLSRLSRSGQCYNGWGVAECIVVGKAIKLSGSFEYGYWVVSLRP